VRDRCSHAVAHAMLSAAAMRSLVLVIWIALAGPARAGGFSDTGPYVAWSLEGWFPRDRLAAVMGHQREDNAQFALIAGLRLHGIAIEAWHAPPMSSGIDVRGVDGKAILPIGRYFAAYARVRLAQMRVDLEYYNVHEPSRTGIGGGYAAGIQAQFPGRMFGLLLPAWFAAPFGFRDTGGVFVEFGEEAYELAIGTSQVRPERFWRFAYGVAWGGAF